MEDPFERNLLLEGYLRLNFDGCLLGYPEKHGTYGLCRDHKRQQLDPCSLRL